jgi:hypothetical protein
MFVRNWKGVMSKKKTITLIMTMDASKKDVFT